MESSGTQPSGTAGGIPVKEGFDTIFENEIESWCYGLARYPGEISADLVHRIVREMMSTFKGAVQHNYVFDLLPTSGRLAKATRHAVSVKEVALSIVVQMPSPFELDEESQFVFAQILDQAEQAYQGTLALLEKKWRKDRSLRTGR